MVIISHYRGERAEKVVWDTGFINATLQLHHDGWMDHHDGWKGW